MGTGFGLSAHSDHVIVDVFGHLSPIWFQPHSKRDSYSSIYCDYNRFVLSKQFDIKTSTYLNIVTQGLENMLVLTKSVVSTPAHLDIKVRVAQGLSREGWSITKNLMTEITLLTIGFFTFVPIIQVWLLLSNYINLSVVSLKLQKLCLFATVGLLSDFFIQITFFATVLSVDIQRMEVSIDSFD